MSFRLPGLLYIALFAMVQVVFSGEAAGMKPFLTEGNTGEVPFFLYLPVALQATPALQPAGVLLLVPGYNGSGEAMIDERWRRFADQNSLILLAQTFKNSNPQELHENRGYYYPEQGSGEEIEKALTEVHRRTGALLQKIVTV